VVFLQGCAKDSGMKKMQSGRSKQWYFLLGDRGRKTHGMFLD